MSFELTWSDRDHDFSLRIEGQTFARIQHEQHGRMAGKYRWPVSRMIVPNPGWALSYDEAVEAIAAAFDRVQEET